MPAVVTLSQKPVGVLSGNVIPQRLLGMPSQQARARVLRVIDGRHGIQRGARLAC